MRLPHIKIAILLLILSLNIQSSFCAGCAQPLKHFSNNSILIINSYTESSVWSNIFIDPIYAHYSSKSNRMDIYTEHMNMLTISTEKALDEYKKELFGRYGDITPKLIVLLGNSAWGLLNEDIEKYWKNVPVILCAEKEYTSDPVIYLIKDSIPQNNRGMLKDYQGNVPLTVFHTPFYIEETLELMEKVIPDMKKLIFLSDRRSISAQSRKQVDAVMKSKYPNIRIEHLIAGDITNDDLISDLKTLAPQTGILFFSWFKKEQQQGNTILTSNISRVLSSYSNAPIFTLYHDVTAANGLIGGYFWENDVIKNRFLETTDEILKNAHPNKVRVIELGTPGPVINYVDFVRAGLNIKRCPSNTSFHAYPPTFLQQNYPIIIGLILFLAFLYLCLYLWWTKRISDERGRKLNFMTNYSSLIENMPILYAKQELIYDTNGQIIDFIYREVNPTFEKYIASKEQILGKKQSEIGKKIIQELLNMYNGLSGKKNLSFQYYHEKEQRYFSVIVTHSKQEGFVDVFCVDNTELSLTQQKLHSANHKLSAALEVADITPWKWDLEKRNILCDVNRPIELLESDIMMNEQQLSVPDSSYFSNICKQDRDRVEAAYRKLINGEVAKIKEEFRVTSKTKNSVHYEWVEVQATVDERDENGRAKSLVGSSLVITARKVMEDALVKAKEKAEESNKLKSAFLANMSHEIRTPLNAIVGFSGILASSDDEEEKEKQEYVHIIENNNNLLLQLINDILDLSKIEAGTLEFVYNSVDIDALFLGIEETTKIRNSNENVHILYNQRIPECYIRTDKNRLTQVITNMINNAMKFTEKGNVEFGYYTKDEDSICFYVTDSGCGIPEDQISNVFDRFVKLNNFAQGTGLGLSICQTIIENMGGKIGVNSKVGEGSTFWFTLPYVRTDKSPQKSQGNEIIREVSEKEKLTILIAEDNESNYKLFESVLKKEYNLIHAWDGVEAVQLFEKYNPHLILMDINMPKMDGYEATRRIHEISPETPIIAVTAFAYAEDEQRIFSGGFDAYTTKPIQAKQLQSQIIDLLRRRFLFM